MTENERLTESIIKIISLTNEGRLRWARAQPVQFFEDLAPSIYSVNFGDHVLRFTYLPLGRFSAITLMRLKDEQGHYKLAVYDVSGDLEFEYPRMSALTGLYSAIRQQIDHAAEPFLRALEQTG